MGRGEHCAIGLVAKHGRGSLLFPNRWSHDKSHDAKRFTTELHHIPHTLDSTVRIALLYTTNTLLVSPRSTVPAISTVIMLHFDVFWYARITRKQ